MTDPAVVCWSCHHVFEAGASSECPNCKAGTSASGRGLSQEQVEEEQQRLRRRVGLPSPVRSAAEDQTAGTDPLIVPKPKLPVRQQAGQLDVDRKLIALPCANCGASISDAEAVYCPRCGERVVDEATEEVTRRMLNILETSVPTIVQRELSDIDEFTDEMETWASAVEQRVRRLEEESRGSFSWKQVSDDEKWNVTWGVWWRVFVLGLMIQIGLFLLIFAIVN